MENRESWLSELVQDLGQRKVDTIVAREGITGRAMPDPATALLDINNTYFRKLHALGLVDLTAANPAAFDDEGWLLPNDAARKMLETFALAGMTKPGLKPLDASVLQRIVSTCGALAPIIKKIEAQLPDSLKKGSGQVPPSVRPATVKDATRRYQVQDRARPELELTRQERAALSKAWELGIDTVALQTISMIGGDIITRITEQYTGEAHAVVRQLHSEAVGLSLSTWDNLVNGVTRLFEGLLGRKE